MSNFCFFFILVQFIASVLLVQGSINRNRGNIINLPTWRKAVINILDGLIIAFVLYYILMPGEDQPLLFWIAAIPFGFFILAILAGVAYDILLRKQIKGKYRFALEMDDKILAPSKSWYTSDLEFVKYAVVAFFKVVLTFWSFLYFFVFFHIVELNFWKPSINTDIIYLKRYLTVLAIFALCCVLDNLLSIIINHDGGKRCSPETEKIRRKLDMTRTPF